MTQPTLIKKSQAWKKEKGLKTVFEYNSGQFDVVDIAKTSMSGRYPLEGWSANDISTMLYYIITGSAVLTLESGESFMLETEDVFMLPPKTWYAIEGKIEALMICSPAWAKEQSHHKE